MKLTPFAKFFVTLIILGVVGYVLYVKRDTITQWANQGGVKPTTSAGDKPAGEGPAPIDELPGAGTNPNWPR